MGVRIPSAFLLLEVRTHGGMRIKGADPAKIIP